MNFFFWGDATRESDSSYTSEEDGMEDDSDLSEHSDFVTHLKRKF